VCALSWSSARRDGGGHAGRPAPAGARGGRCATADALAAPSLAEQPTDAAAARVRVLVAHRHGDVRAVLAELPNLRGDEERHLEAMLLAVNALTAAGRAAEAARLRDQAARTFIVSGRGVVLRHRALRR